MVLPPAAGSIAPAVVTLPEGVNTWLASPSNRAGPTLRQGARRDGDGPQRAYSAFDRGKGYRGTGAAKPTQRGQATAADETERRDGTAGGSAAERGQRNGSAAERGTAGGTGSRGQRSGSAAGGTGTAGGNPRAGGSAAGQRPASGESGGTAAGRKRNRI